MKFLEKMLKMRQEIMMVKVVLYFVALLISNTNLWFLCKISKHGKDLVSTRAEHYFCIILCGQFREDKHHFCGEAAAFFQDADQVCFPTRGVGLNYTNNTQIVDWRDCFVAGIIRLQPFTTVILEQVCVLFLNRKAVCFITTGQFSGAEKMVKDGWPPAESKAKFSQKIATKLISENCVF